MIKNKKIAILFLGNVKHDSRTNNLYYSLSKWGNKVQVISCDWLANENEINEEIKIFKIQKPKFSLAFYSKAYLVFVKEVLKFKPEYCFAEDVFTLPVAALLKFFLGFKLIYDSRELYPFLAGLRRKKVNQFIVKTIEKIFIKSADKILTTGKMDKEFIEDYYKLKNVLVLRNLPLKRKVEPVDLRKEFGVSNAFPILIYQGVLLEGRGITLIIKALKRLQNFNFLILGEGPFKSEFQNIAKDLAVDDKVIFGGRIPQDKLLNYTAGADAGLAIIENLSKSYFLALPNKLFEYLMAGLPVVISPLPQMVEIVNKYNVGVIIDSFDPDAIANAIERLLKDSVRMQLFRENALDAAKELNWENEFNKLPLE